MENHSYSGLLTPEENTNILQWIRKSHFKNQILSTSVVQLLVADEMGGRHWTEKKIGVACLIKDFSRQSYFIQIMDMDFYQMVWEQELYIEMDYRTPQPWVHMFEADDHQVALNFADETEAELFKSKVLERIQKNKERQGKVFIRPSTSFRTKEVKPPQFVRNREMDASTRKKKGKIDKKDISGPDLESFIHMSGVKLEATGEMRVVDNSDQLDPFLRKFLKMSGIDVQAMGKKEIQEAKEAAIKLDIYGTLPAHKPAQKPPNKHQQQQPPPPPRSRPTGGPPPIPVRRDHPAGTLKRPDHPRAAVPSPPMPPHTHKPSAFSNKPPGGYPQKTDTIGARKGTPSAAAAVPPPPPPPPPPQMPQPTMASLPHVTDRSNSPTRPESGGNNELLSDIRNWKDKVKLKKPCAESGTAKTPTTPPTSVHMNITEIMIEKMKEFQGKVLINSSDEEEEDDSWDSD